MLHQLDGHIRFGGITRHSAEYVFLLIIGVFGFQTRTNWQIQHQSESSASKTATWFLMGLMFYKADKHSKVLTELIKICFNKKFVI